MPDTLSAVVISFNRAAIVGTCLRGLRFADEVIVVDKSSTDGTAGIAIRHADRVISVPWTPTVEDTRAFAVAQCSGDWILCLDDDECLAPAAGEAIRAELAAPRADIYSLPLRHYILGVHDEAAYCWPEYHPRLFRRGAVSFTPTVHGGMRLGAGRVVQLPPDGGAVIHHLSHRNVQEWVDKTNRYTARADRVRVDHAGQDVVAFAHAQIDHWQSRTRDRTPGSYPTVAGLLRALYDIIDRLKIWEEERGLDGAAAFAAICREFDAAHGDGEGNAGRPVLSCAGPPIVGSERDAARDALLARVGALRGQCDAAAADAARWAAEAERLVEEAARRDAALAAVRQERDRAQQALRLVREQLAAIESSTCWRVTAGARRLADRARHFGQTRRQS